MAWFHERKRESVAFYPRTKAINLAASVAPTAAREERLKHCQMQQEHSDDNTSLTVRYALLFKLRYFRSALALRVCTRERMRRIVPQASYSQQSMQAESAGKTYGVTVV
jgi:hypothetical protein